MEKPQLSALEYVSLLYAVSRTLATLTWTASTGWTRGQDCPRSYKNHVIYSAIRTLLGHVSMRHLQALGGTTRGAYNDFTKKHKIEPTVVELDEGGYGLFLGPETAKVTLLWLHGGGYINPAGEDHWSILWDLIKLANDNGSELRVMLLEYELAPHRVYPVQLKQAAAALKYLLDSGLRPSQILVGGDSAGGNLGLALLGHLSHPHPEVQALSLSDNLRGVLLVSPWATFDQSAASFTTNLKKDGLTPSALKAWSDSFMGTSPPDNYNTPRDAPPDWWRGLKVSGKDLAIIGGGDEILVDDIRAVAENIKVDNPDVEYLEAEGEAHDAMLGMRMFGTTEELASDEFSKQWLVARLK